MRTIFLFLCILLLVLFAAIYLQYRSEIAVARQKDLEGSQLLITENGNRHKNPVFKDNEPN